MVGSEVPLRPLAAMIAAFTTSMTIERVARVLGFADLSFLAGATTAALTTNEKQYTYCKGQY